MLVDEEIDVESRREIILRDARSDLILYNTICVPDYIAGRMHRFIASKLEAVARGEITRLIINTPPQYGKSRLCSIAAPTWMLGNNPRINVCAASYSQNLSNRNSRESRERIKSNEYQDVFPGTQLSDDNQGIEHWSTTKGGSYKAVGIGGSLSGHSADVLVIDDFLKDYEQAQSDVIREKVWEWFWSVAYTRLSPGAPIIIIGTRWSVDDLCGRLLDPKRIAALDNEQAKSEKWEHINLPSIAQEDDPLGREPGEPLFPERYSKERVLAHKSVTLPYIWSAMHDGNPVQKGGNYIKVDKFNIHRYAKENLRWVWAWDLATSDDRKNDYTAGCAMAVDENKELWIRRMTRGQWIWPVARTMIAAIALEEKYFPFGIEAVAGFKTAYQNLVEVLPAHIRCIELNVEKDKLTRAQPWITMVYNEKVNLVQGDWVPDFLLECTAFPSGKHDDMCLVGETLVLCKRGNIEIKDVISGDFVWTRRGWRKVVWSGKTGLVSELVEISTNHGNSVTATPNHPIWTQEKGFFNIDAVSIGYRILECLDNTKNHRIRKQLFTRESRSTDTRSQNNRHTETIIGRTPVMSETGSDIFTRKFGRTYMDRFRTEALSTISTETSQTTQLTIFNLWPVQETTQGTISKMEILTHLPQDNSSIWKQSGRLPSRGTAPRRDWNGTENTASNAWRKGRRSKRNVANAAKNLRRNNRGVFRVRARAMENGIAPNLKTEYHRYANYAERNSRFISTKNQFFAHGVVDQKRIIKLENPIPVFNLEIEGEHEFFANGILVHNCDAVSLGWRMLTDASINPTPVDVNDKYRRAMAERRQRTVE